jgi:predicted nucleic acid-binding protein
MNSSIFLDTTVFFHCIEHDRLGTILEHANNAGYKIQTSISVIGEAFTQMHEGCDAVRYITALNQLLDDWNITVLFPNEHVRVLCYQMGEVEIDTRMIREPTDRTHLAYAMAYHSDYFLTSDKNLIKYRIPSSFGEVGFFKPVTMPLDTFRDTVLNKTS